MFSIIYFQNIATARATITFKITSFDFRMCSCLRIKNLKIIQSEFFYDNCMHRISIASPSWYIIRVKYKDSSCRT